MKSSSRSKRSSSPLSTIERRSNDGYRSVERSLNELAQLLTPNQSKVDNNNSLSPTSSQCSISTTELNALNTSVRQVIKTLEQSLRTKLSDLATRRMELRRNNQFNDKINLQLLAEKLAYEAVIIERIQDALQTTTNQNSRIQKSELLETSHLIANLKRKLNGKCIKRALGSKVSLEYLTKVLSNKLLKSGHLVSNITGQKCAEEVEKPNDRVLEFLISKRDELNISFVKYKNTKMEQLANALAAETLSYVATEAGNRCTKFDERRVREAWQMAQETVNNELIQSEISHVMMRCAQMYENSCKPDGFFTFYASERGNMEIWIEQVENR